MKLGHKLYIGFGIPILALIAIGIYSIYSFDRINGRIEAIHDDRAIPLEQLKDISDNYAVRIIDAVNKTNEQMMTFEDALISVKMAQEEIDRQWQNYLETELTPREEELVNEIERLFVSADDQIQKTLIPVLQRGDRQRLSNLDGTLYLKIDPITERLRELVALQLEVANEERQKATRVYRETLIVFGTLLAVAVLIGSPFGFWFIRRGITAALAEAIDTISTSSTEIAATTEEQDRIASSQASSVNQTTTSMDELNASSQQAAEQAEASSSSAREALKLSETGTQAVERTMAGMEKLRESVSAISTQIVRLSDRTEQIGSISSLVSDLANQTNMLALNAAVEAVRAGEHGKGFGVVAAEIRKLADQSQQAANKINALVGDVQGEIDSTVMVTDDGTKTVEAGVKIVRETANAFAGVADAIEQVVENNQQSSLTAQQQALAIEQVVAAMNDLNSAARETASGISQIKAGTLSLKQTAETLRSMV